MDWLRIAGLLLVGAVFVALVAVISDAATAIAALPGVIAVGALSFQYTEKWRRPSLRFTGPARPRGYEVDVYTLQVVNHRLDALAVHFAGVVCSQGTRVRFPLPESNLVRGGWSKTTIEADDVLKLRCSDESISHELFNDLDNPIPTGSRVRIRPIVEYGADKTAHGKWSNLKVIACGCHTCRERRDQVATMADGRSQ